VPTNPELSVATAFARAGRAAEAEPHAVRAAKSCVRIADPFAHAHAELELGLVEESLGKAEAACEAYRAVLAQWGTAKPRSVTAERARERMRALACSR
jgi:serine/threonine-protein kinase